MILETAKRPNNRIIECPDWIDFLALVWLLFEDLVKFIGPRLVRYEVFALVQYDRTHKAISSELQTYTWVWAVGRMFCCFYLILLGINALEGILKWLQ